MTILINAYCTVSSIPELSFSHTLRGKRDVSDPELGTHLQGFIGYVLRHKTQEMTQEIYYTIQHIRHVKNHLSFEIETTQLTPMSEWAKSANAILFLPDGTIRNPSGEMIIPRQNPPVMPPHPANSIRRKKETEKKLHAEGLRTPDSLPPVLDESEVDLQSASDCARRVLGLFIVALRAESIASKKPIPQKDLFSRFPGAAKYLTSAETHFMQDNAPSEQEVTNFTWRYECINILLWCLEKVGTVESPHRICDVPSIARTVLTVDQSEFIGSARYRATSEILDQLDYHYRLQWLSHQHRAEGKELPHGLNSGIIQERLHALSWLTGSCNVAWDDIDTSA